MSRSRKIKSSRRRQEAKRRKNLTNRNPEKKYQIYIAKIDADAKKVAAHD
jgi:hypothetical protein